MSGLLIFQNADYEDFTLKFKFIDYEYLTVNFGYNLTHCFLSPIFYR